MNKKEKAEQETIIEAHQSWFYVDWKGLFHYRDLLFLLVRRDFIAKYKQTILGPLWFIIQPLLTTLVFTVIFGKFSKIPTDKLPPVLFYLCGLLAWNYFAQCLTSIAASLTNNAHLFSKVYFPRLIVPLSIIISNLMTFAIQAVTFLAFYFYFKIFTSAGSVINPNGFILLLPLLLLETAAVSLGIGLWIAALTVKYRDFQHLVSFLVQLWMYATPVIYPVSSIPDRWQFLTVLNPMSGIVESYRYAFFGTGFVDFRYLMTSAGLVLFSLVTGLLIFNRVERTFVDTI